MGQKEPRSGVVVLENAGHLGKQGEPEIIGKSSLLRLDMQENPRKSSVWKLQILREQNIHECGRTAGT